MPREINYFCEIDFKNSDTLDISIKTTSASNITNLSAFLPIVKKKQKHQPVLKQIRANSQKKNRQN